MSQYNPKYVKKILFDTQQLYAAIKKAAIWATKKFKNDRLPPVFLCLLKGALPFYSTLIMNIDCDIITDFMVVSSFRGQITKQTKPQIITDILADIKNRNVIICDDVIDSGETLSFLKRYLTKKGAKNVYVMVLADKPKCHKVNIKADYACFIIKNKAFLIGYGLDINEKARNLPYLAEFDKKYLHEI